MACKAKCGDCKCKKAIITGITGQDGSYLADLLLEKNYKVLGVTRRSSTNTSYRLSNALKNPRFKLVEGDITDYSSMLNILHENDDAVEFYNLAAQSHVGASFNQPTSTWDITGKGCINILQAIVDLSLQRSMKFYQASSSEMFGKNHDSKVILDKGSPHYKEVIKYQDENTKFVPQSPYAIAKCAAHYATRLYREAYGLHASSGILFNHEGPRRGERFVTRKITKWIGQFMNWRGNSDVTFADDYIVKNTATFPKLRLGNLESRRDWGFAGDYVEAMWLMLQRNTPDDYVICTGETHTIREFLDVAFNYVGISNWSHYVVQDPEFYRPAEVDYLKGDSSKARNLLGWRPQTSFNHLVKMMVENDLNEL